MKKNSCIKLSVLLSLLFVLQLMFFPVNALALTTNSSILPPSNLAFQLVTPDDVKLTWSSVYGANGYNVYGITDGQLKLLGTTTSTTYSFSNLPEGSYTYVVSTLSADGESGPCAPIYVDIVYPDMATPTTLTNTFQNVNDIILSWSASQYAQTYNIYEISIDGQKTLVTSVTGRTYTITNAAEGTHTYAVSAVNSMYGESSISEPLQVNVVFPTMAAPGNVTYKIQNGNDVVLTWGAVTYANSYKVYELIDGQEVLKTTVTSLTATLSNVPAGDHTYVVHSVSTRFGESSEGRQVLLTVDAQTMQAPANLTYSLTNGTNITLKWDAVSFATAYNVYQVIDGGKVLKSTVTGTSVAYNNLPVGSYVYEVHSYSDRFGESPEGSQVSIGLGDVTMAPPSNFAYTIINGNDIVLNWDSVPNAINYKIYQITNGQKVLKSTVTGTTVSYTNMPAGNYSYEIHSYSTSYGESAEGSQLVFNLTFPIMQPPANLVQTIKNATDFSLSWDASSYANSYKVYQIVNGQKVLKNTVTGTTVAYTNMAPGDYSFEVHSYSTRFGVSPEGSTLVVTLNGQTMQAPTNLTYTLANQNDITLKWTAATYAASYKIYQVIDGQNVLKKTVTSTSTTFSNMPAGDYHYVVTSVSSLFGESPNGAEVTLSLVLPTMAAPSNLTYKIQNVNSVVLTWDAVTYANSYKVYELINGQKVLKNTVTSLTATILNVSAGDHTYIVHSVSSRFGESQEGSQVSFTLNQQMLAPADLVYSIANGNDITLKWTAASYATSYKIYQVIDGQKQLVKTVTTTTATFTNMPAGDYDYVVTSVSTVFGESSSGSEVTLSLVLPTMAAPSNLTYKIQNVNSVVLTWTAASYANSYKVYEVVDGQEVLKTTVTSLTATIPNVSVGDHTYVVHSVSTRFGESQEGSQVSFTLNQQMLPPTNLSYSIVNGNDITLRWTAASYANTYKIYQVIDGQKQFVKTVTTTTATFTNMPAGDYDYVVTSMSTVFGESLDGSEVTFSLVLPVMAAPGNLTQSIANGNDIKLKWNSVTYATAYRVYQMIDGQKSLVKTMTGTSVTFTNMPAGDYIYEVDSYCDRFGESPVGSTVNFTLIWPVVQPPLLKETVYNVNNITLSWQAVSWANEYRVYEIKDDTRQLLYKGTALSYKMYNLSEDTHNYEVTAYNTRFGESAPSNRITEVIIYPDMQAPTATLRLLDSTSALITWNFITYANGYNVYEIVDGKPVLLTENLNNLSYQVNNLSYMDHQYYVTSFSNSFGESQPSNTVIAKLIVDTDAPVTTSNAPVNWMNQSPLVINLSATDNETGVANTYYSINDGNFTEGTSITVDIEGINKISFYSVDKVDNKEAVKTVEVKIDKTAPVITMDLNKEYKLGDTLQLTYIAKDNLSGVVDEKMVVTGPGETSGKIVDNNTTMHLDKPGTYNIAVTVTDAAGHSTTIQRQFVIYISATIEVTPRVIKGNNGVFTVRASVPTEYATQGFDLNTATLNGVKALTSNNGYYNQAKLGQFKFERSDFDWTPSEMVVEFRCYVNGYLVVGQTLVKIQK